MTNSNTHKYDFDSFVWHVLWIQVIYKSRCTICKFVIYVTIISKLLLITDVQIVQRNL